MSTLLDRVLQHTGNLVNRIGPLNGAPYDPALPSHPPTGGWGVAHYGIMVPDLPAPVNFFDVISLFGTAKRIRAYSVPSLVRTTPEDSAWLLLGSAVSRDNFRPYSIADDCTLTEDASDIRIGDVLRIRRDHDITVHARPDGLTADLVLRPTEHISHFAHLPGVYDHWSRLCEYEGTFTPDGGEPITSSGLCTWEYARGRTDVPLPIRFFTYQILNISDRVQVLMTELLGPAGIPFQRMVFVRDLDRGTATYTRGFVNTVHRRLPTHTTPDGAAMELPAEFTWSVNDDDGRELITVHGVARDDFAYGMAAGFAGSYDYTGRYLGTEIAGGGYIEWIDR
ncbi:DUF6670 family protein [Gordonia sp. (in: high G+C Gram-positive bacteria)]|uniref:DUF6670 family protein n=1 Tax=Gordonia sp. (in: high G+C Gram-positive bacteria) TaxID=84139 RepID=UPI0026021963|nr:DUF6670 family protein [Gordonia sp. (in: high G+C Gram-positive bacteria)]